MSLVTPVPSKVLVLPVDGPNSPTFLVDMPSLVMKELLKFLDCRSILLLRKTCHSIRDSIDFLKPNLQFTSIDCQVTLENVFLELNCREGTQRKIIWYSEDIAGCEVLCRPMKKYFKDTNFVDLALSDYEMLLNYQNKRLDWFDLNLQYPMECREKLEPIAQKVLRRVKTILTQRDHPLKAENFRMTIIRQDQAVELLKLIYSKRLKLISLHGKKLFPMLEMKCDELEKLKQWKEAEKVEIWRFNFLSPVEKLMNFREVTVFFETVSIEDVMKVKETFLTSPTPNKVSIKYNVFAGKDQMNSTLGKFHYEENRHGEWIWTWVLTRDSAIVVSICHTSHYTPEPGYIEFNRVKKENLSEEQLKIIQEV